jgi:hypothetical protein
MGEAYYRLCACIARELLRFAILMRRPKRMWPILILTSAMAACASTADKPEQANSPPAQSAKEKSVKQVSIYSVRSIAVGVMREQDDVKYPVPVKESYELSATGTLRYSAYFHNMPTNMNHNDSADWQAGAAAQSVLSIVQGIVDDPSAFAGLVLIPDEGESPCEASDYRVGVTREQADLDYCAKAGSAAFRSIHGAFSDLITAFEVSEKRPLAPSNLPQ